MKNSLLMIATTISIFIFILNFPIHASDNNLNCENKLKPYKSPWISGCQMGFDGESIYEKYESLHPNNKVLRLEVCLRKPVSFEKAKKIANELIKFENLSSQGDRNYWVVQLQSQTFYNKLEKKTLDTWNRLRELMDNYKGAAAKMC